MKRMICLFVMAGLVAAGGAIAADVPSVNAVGYQTVDIAPSFNMISLNWNGIGGSNEVSVQDLMDVSNLKKGTSPGSADNLALWDADTQTYTILFLYDYATTYWDGKWCAVGPKISTNMISAGQGMWLKSTSASNVTIQVSGQVPNGATATHTFAGNGKFSMFGSAYSADVAVNSLGLTNGIKGTSPGSADNLALFDKNTQTYTILFLYDYSTSYWDGKWCVVGPKISTNVLRMGEGAWYKRFLGSGDLEWTQSRPYTLD